MFLFLWGVHRSATTENLKQKLSFSAEGHHAVHLRPRAAYEIWRRGQSWQAKHGPRKKTMGFFPKTAGPPNFGMYLWVSLSNPPNGSSVKKRRCSPIADLQTHGSTSQRPNLAGIQIKEPSLYPEKSCRRLKKDSPPVFFPPKVKWQELENKTQLSDSEFLS